jgi:hypothetical protein
MGSVLPAPNLSRACTPLPVAHLTSADDTNNSECSQQFMIGFTFFSYVLIPIRSQAASNENLILHGSLAITDRSLRLTLEVKLGQMPPNQDHFPPALALVRQFGLAHGVVQDLEYLSHALNHLFGSIVQGQPALQPMNLKC